MYKNELKFAEKLAREAGAKIRENFLLKTTIELKGDGSPVTELDKHLNSLSIERIKSEFPEDEVIGEEEQTAELGLGRRWICDPIDGTIAFLEGVPTATYSLALVIDGEPVMGVVYNPMIDDMYSALVNGGAFVNGEPIKVSGKGMKQGTIAVSSDQSKLAMGIEHVQKLAQSESYISSFSGMAYKACLVARGVFVGSISTGSRPVDVAAGALIVNEAGGKSTTLDGKRLDFSNDFSGVILSNDLVHNELAALF